MHHAVWRAYVAELNTVMLHVMAAAGARRLAHPGLGWMGLAYAWPTVGLTGLPWLMPGCIFFPQLAQQHV